MVDIIVLGFMYGLAMFCISKFTCIMLDAYEPFNRYKKK